MIAMLLKPLLKRELTEAAVKFAPVGKTWDIKGALPKLRLFGRKLRLTIVAEVEE